VREILGYHPNLEARDNQGRTAMFVVGEFRRQDTEEPPVECVRLLAQAGADVNARDGRGNTPLHRSYSVDIDRELLKLGADVNARNHNGETPIFTNLNNESIVLFIRHGADLSIRNNQGEDVVQAAAEMGTTRQEALRKAIETLVQH
jgi:ankyrin repeat protein